MGSFDNKEIGAREGVVWAAFSVQLSRCQFVLDGLRKDAVSDILYGKHRNEANSLKLSSFSKRPI